MAKQTPITEEELKQVEYILNGRKTCWQDRFLYVFIAEIRRLRKDNELGWTISEELSKQISAVHEENERLKEGYKKILEYPLTGAEYADIAEAMRYRQIARATLGEVGELEKRQTTNDQAGDE